MTPAMQDEVRILIVDDEPRAIELLTRTLRKVGAIDRAPSGDAALVLLREHTYDLVISDQRMPGLSGVDLLTAVAEGRDDRCGRILLTGYADLEATVDAINRGRVHAYLHKPCSPHDLMMVVKNVLARVGFARENERLLAVVTEQNAQLTAALASLRDAQERVVASERLAAVGKAVAMIVHDLRGPLAVLQAGASETSREGRERDILDLRELGAELTAEVERVKRMCDELLEVTRATDGAAVRERHALDDATSLALASLLEEAGRLGVRLELDLASGVEVALDRSRWRRLLENLVRNALEALPEGGTIRVVSRVEGGQALVCVSDDGAGIPEAIQATLFDPFVTSGKAGGTGLGLAIVRAIALDHGGSVAVAKSLEGGAAFEVRLPLSAAS